VGLYLSPWDRNAPYWGTAQYSKYYAAQLSELLSNYGRIVEVWWDGAGSNETPYDWGMWAYTVRNLQPPLRQGISKAPLTLAL
jgi:alpha-L-fucosidase